MLACVCMGECVCSCLLACMCVSFHACVSACVCVYVFVVWEGEKENRDIQYGSLTE